MPPAPAIDLPAQGRTDTHVHIFRRDATLSADRRYAPDYDATPAQLLANMQPAGITRAVLVQPSFLGTDNSFLLAAIAADPAHFSGIAVVDPEITIAALENLRAQGVIGVRLNCIGRPAPGFATTHAQLVAHLTRLGMVLQIQAEGDQWPAMAGFLENPPLDVIIDHFGRTPQDHPSGGFACLMRAAARTDRLWFKFSAPYRLPPDAAGQCAQRIFETVGTRRILWGSDWPHTQFEGRNSYRDTLDWLARWIPDAGARETILSVNPARLFATGSPQM